SQGKKIILTSDMYLSKEDIISLLVHNNFDINLIDNLFVSCELNLNKKQGELFDYILKTYNVSPANLSHIGDNYYSDYYNASIRGVTAIHYELKTSNLLKGIEIENFYSEDIAPELLSL